MTELLLATDERSSVYATIDPILTSIKERLIELCTSRPNLQVTIAPPLFRSRPSWYHQNMSWVATQFSSCFSSDRPQNLHLLPSHINQEMGPDGVLLTPVAGLHYILHLFDQSVSILGTLSASTEDQVASVRESSRSHDDRLAYLEHDNSRLRRQVNIKIAADAEFSDWMVNRSEENWCTINGLPRLPSGFDGRDWQVAAKRQVQDFFKQVLKANKAHVSFEVLYVANPVRFCTSGPTVLNVQLNSVEASKRLREVYSGFFRRVNPVKKIPIIKGVSLRNKITLDSKIRIAIMRQLGEKYVEKNQGASYKVSGIVSRPNLKLFPASGATDSRIQSFNFIEAVTTIPSHLSDSALTQIFMTVGGHNRGKLRQLFVILSDDHHDRCLELVKKHQAENRGDRRGSSRSSRGGSSVTSSQRHSVTFSNAGAGMETEAGVVKSLRQPPPPPPSPTVSEEDQEKDQRSQPVNPSSGDLKKKSQKRGRNDSVSSNESPAHKSDPNPTQKSKKRSKRSRSSSSSSGSDSSDHRSKKKKKSKSKKHGRSRKSRKHRKSSSSSSSSGSGSASASASDSGASVSSRETKKRH